MNLNDKKAGVALLSVISNSTLVLLKIIVGVAMGSVSVISEAIHSGVDLLAALIALFAVRHADKPADDEHPFGHGKLENISGTVEALLIFVAAAWIIFEAVKKLMHPEPLGGVGLGVIIMSVSSAANLLVSARLFKIGKETDSVALQADAWHLRTDVYTSAGVMAGLAVIGIGHWVAPGVDLYWVDPVAAIAVAMLIIKAAYNLTIESGRDLMDMPIPPEEEKWIQDYAESLSDVKGFHRLRTRKSGSHRFVQFHLLVSGGMSVEASHKLNDDIVSAIKAHLPNCNVAIHIEPCTDNSPAECEEDLPLPCEHDEEADGVKA